MTETTKTKGHMSMTTQVVVSGIGFITAIGGAYVSTSASVNEKISNVRTDVEVIREREDLHYLEVQKQMANVLTSVNEVNENSRLLNSKMDGILNSFRKNPNY